MNSIIIREPRPDDQTNFLEVMQNSTELYSSWIKVPLTPNEYIQYLTRHQNDMHQAYLALNGDNKILGVFNISGITRGAFESAYLGFYANSDYSGKGLMSASLKIVLQKIFEELKLHRIEANVQPTNLCSLRLIQKNGFKKEGYSPRYLKIDGEWRDHERWALTYEDWKG